MITKNPRVCKKPRDYDTIYTDVYTGGLLGNIFACFFKVSFYRMQIVKNFDQYKDNPEVYNKYRSKVYDFTRFLMNEVLENTRIRRVYSI